MAAMVLVGPFARTMSGGLTPAAAPTAVLSSLPSQAEGVISTAVGSGELRFSAEPTRSGYSLSGGGVVARVTHGGAVLSAGGASVRLAVAAIGRGRHQDSLGAGSVAARGNRVTIDRPGLSEWYAAGPFGIEQGFTIARRPGGATGALTLALTARSSLAVRASSSGVQFLGRSGHVMLRYGGLSAVDASGRVLPSSLIAGNGHLVLRVLDSGARYPVRIDPFVQQGSKLVGTGASGAEQGFSVALSGDGNTALIGGPYNGGNQGAGAAWIFTRSGGVWSQQGSKLTASDETGNGDFGSGVALSSDGNTALIGGPADNGYAGAAWVFTRSGGVWSQQGSKLVGTGATDAAGQGTRVALSGDGNTALIGGPFDNSDGGSSWVFTRSGAAWSQQGSKLVGTGATGSGAEQGWDVALSYDGNTALIGGQADNTETGAAWVFTRAGTAWSQQGSKLTANDGAPTARFGFSVALSSDGNTALIGGEGNSGVGAAWVFTRSAAVWSQQGSKLVGTGASGAAAQGFGVALSDDGNTALIGGPSDNGYEGAAWVFTRSGAVWSQQGSKLVGTAPSGSAQQGTSVALSGDGSTALIGGPLDNSYAGAAWVFGTQRTLTIARAGSGSGTVTSSPAGINCGSTCTAVYGADTQVTLSATPAPGSVFTGWAGGGCSGTGTCTLTLTDNKVVTATFSHPTPGTPSAPVLSGLSVSPGEVSLSGRLVHGQCKALTGGNRHHAPCRLKLKLRVAFNLSAAGSVTVAFYRVTTGRRVKSGCARPTHANRHRPHCVLLSPLGGGLTRIVGLGKDTITITRSGLPPGSYRLSVTPSAGGRTGKPQSASFTITA